MNRSRQEQNQIKIRKNTILITHYTLSEKENVRFSSHATHAQWPPTATVNTNWWRIDVLLLPACVRPLWAMQDSAPTRPDTYLILIWDKPIISAYPTAPHCTKRFFRQSAIDKYDIWNPGQNKTPLPRRCQAPRTLPWQPSVEIAFSLLLPPPSVAHGSLCKLLRQPWSVSYCFFPDSNPLLLGLIRVTFGLTRMLHKSAANDH